MERRGFNAAVVTLTFALVCLFAFIYMVRQPNADPDMFWRITEGQWIIAHEQVPTVDVLSWYRGDHPGHLAPQTWLFEVVLAVVYSLGGYGAVYLLASLFFGMVLPLSYFYARSRSAPPSWALLAGVVVVLGAIQGASPRPQVITMCLLLAVALLLERDWWKPALGLVVLGVNMHGGVWPLYVLVFAFYLLPKRPGVFAAGLLACAVTPDPFGILALPFVGFVNGSVGNLSEFAPLALWERPLDLIVLALALIVLTRRSLPRREGLFCMVLILMALSSVRHVLWAYVLAVPIVTAHASLSFGLRPATESGSVVMARYAEVAMVTMLALGVAAGVREALALELDVGRGYPLEMAAYLKENPAPRMLNRFEEGGFLMANGIEPMLDTRGQPFSESREDGAVLLDDYFDLMTLRQNPHKVLDRYGVEHLLLPRQSPLSMSIATDSAFAVERIDATHVLYSYEP